MANLQAMIGGTGQKVSFLSGANRTQVEPLYSRISRLRSGERKKAETTQMLKYYPNWIK
jgi:hypothetical protein